MDEETPSAPESTSVANPAQFLINDTDRAGLIVVVTTFCLISVWLLFFTRAYIRVKGKAWKLDDTFVAVATILTTVRSAVVYLEVRRGYGKSSELLEAGAVAGIGKAIFGDLILYFFTMLFSKCAVLLLCQRMTPKREHWKAIGAIFCLSVIWSLSSILLVSIQCSPGHEWVDLPSQCTNIAARWKAICALDIISEFFIFCCAIYLVAGLHMSWVLKAIVIAAFGIRLPTMLFSGLHLHSLLKEISASDPTLAGPVTSAWRQFALDYSIVACTLSSLGAFLKPFDQELGPSRSGSNQHYVPGSRNFAMQSLRSGTTSNKPTSQVSIDLPILRPDPTANTATVTFSAAASDRESVGSNDSKKGIIMKKQWIVDRGSRRESEADA